MKKIYVLIGLIVVVLVSVFAYRIFADTGEKTATLAELGVSESDYCCSTKIAMLFYKGVAWKSCVCEGENVVVYYPAYDNKTGENLYDKKGNALFVSRPPNGLLTDSSDVYCKGKITGYKFYYRGGGEFNTLQEWENFCNTSAKNQEDCFDNLNYTKATIDYYDNKNADAIKDYYNNKKNNKKPAPAT